MTALERLIADYECIDTEYTSPSPALVAAARAEHEELVAALRRLAIELDHPARDHARAILATHAQ